MPRQAVLYLTTREQRDERAATSRRPDGLQVVATVREHGEHSREGLHEALAMISAGSASTLLAARLGELARTPAELLELCDWLAAAGGDLVALDVAFDSRSCAGRGTLAVLRELELLGGTHADGRAKPGRPGIAHERPDLRERISSMRERGLSLQAIADELQAEGLPTPRGGARWRPSSVQAAAGYRRPRPPGPGAPLPLPPHPPPGLRPPRPLGEGPPRRRAEPAPPARGRSR